MEVYDHAMPLKVTCTVNGSLRYRGLSDTTLEDQIDSGISYHRGEQTTLSLLYGRRSLGDLHSAT
jgi:hypothetical protein